MYGNTACCALLARGEFVGYAAGGGGEDEVGVELLAALVAGEILDEFRLAGGRIITVDEVEPNLITEPSRLGYTSRSFGDFDMYYFVNTADERVTAKIEVKRRGGGRKTSYRT